MNEPENMQENFNRLIVSHREAAQLRDRLDQLATNAQLMMGRVDRRLAQDLMDASAGKQDRRELETRCHCCPAFHGRPPY